MNVNRTLLSLCAVLPCVEFACGDDSSTDAAADTDGPGETDAGADGDADGDAAADGDPDAEAETEVGGDADADADGCADDADDDADGPEACHASVATWDPAWTALEDQAVSVVNARRALGADCRTEGTFAPAGAVDMEPHLRCAARLHSLYLAAVGTLTYDTPGGALGETLWETVTGAGYAGVVVSQTLGSGFDTAESLIDMLLSSDRDCATLLHPDATQIGIGHSGAGSGMFAHTWTIVLGHE